MAELDRLDRAYGLGAMPSASMSEAGQGPRSRGPLLSGLLVTVVTAVLFAAVVAVSPAGNMLAIRRLVGFDDERLAAAPRVRQGIGSYEFCTPSAAATSPLPTTRAGRLRSWSTPRARPTITTSLWTPVSHTRVLQPG